MASISSIFKLRRHTGVQAAAIYTFSNFFNKGVSFLLLFYFAQVLTESDFGLLNLFSNSMLFLMPFVSMGILQSANTEFFKLPKKDFRNFFTSTLLMPAAVSLLAMVVLFVFKDTIQQRYPFKTIFILLVPLITFFSFLNEHLINIVRNNQEPFKYLRINFGRLLAEITLAVFFISIFNCGWMGRVMAIFISFLFIAAYAVFYFYEQGYIFGSISKKYLRAEILYSVPIIVLQISTFCMSASGGYFIEFFTHDFSAVGVYSVAVTFGSVILVLCTALLQYVYPKVYGILSEKEVNYAAIRKIFLFYTGTMLLGTAAVMLATPLAYSFLLKPSYSPGIRYFYLICLGNLFWSISYFFYSFMLYHKQKRKILTVSLLSIFISFTTNYFFTKQGGSFGAAAAVCFSYFAVLIITTGFVFNYISTIFNLKIIKSA